MTGEFSTQPEKAGRKAQHRAGNVAEQAQTSSSVATIGSENDVGPNLKTLETLNEEIKEDRSPEVKLQQTLPYQNIT